MNAQFWLWLDAIAMLVGGGAILMMGKRRTPEEEAHTAFHGIVPIIGDAMDAVMRGGLPIAASVLLHPAATAQFLGVVSAMPVTQPPAWLHVLSWAWLAIALAWAGHAALRRRGRALAEPGLLVFAFAALPPLTAFAIYFVCLHAPRHMMGLVRHPVRAPRVRSRTDAILRSLPVTGLMLLIGAALWPLYAGPAPERLLALTLQGLAALTLPHMLLEALAERLFP